MSKTELVPKFPIPEWTVSCPSGRIISKPSIPELPAEYGLIATPTPVTLLPFLWPLKSFFWSQLKSSRVICTASFAYALVSCVGPGWKYAWSAGAFR